MSYININYKMGLEMGSRNVSGKCYPSTSLYIIMVQKAQRVIYVWVTQIK